jgi:hypothetical protein
MIARPFFPFSLHFLLGRLSLLRLGLLPFFYYRYGREIQNKEFFHTDSPSSLLIGGERDGRIVLMNARTSLRTLTAMAC